MRLAVDLAVAVAPGSAALVFGLRVRFRGGGLDLDDLAVVLLVARVVGLHVCLGLGFRLGRPLALPVLRRALGGVVEALGAQAVLVRSAALRVGRVGEFLRARLADLAALAAVDELMRQDVRDEILAARLHLLARRGRRRRRHRNHRRLRRIVGRHFHRVDLLGAVLAAGHRGGAARSSRHRDQNQNARNKKLLHCLCLPNRLLPWDQLTFQQYEHPSGDARCPAKFRKQTILPTNCTELELLPHEIGLWPSQCDLIQYHTFLEKSRGWGPFRPSPPRNAKNY